MNQATRAPTRGARLRRTRRLLGSASLGLSRELWLVEIGIFLNMLGYGAVLPFEIIYLHNGRGFSLGVAGLIIGVVTGAAIVVAPLAGPLIDRFGARPLTAGAGIALAAGYTGLAFAHVPAEAFASAVLAGVGNGAMNPSQSALMATLSSSDLRHRATAVSRVAGNAGIGIGGALGGLIAAYGLSGFVVLFLANAVTYVLFVGVLLAVVRKVARPEPIQAGYRLVLRDRPFIRLAFVHMAVIAVGWGVFTWLVPPFARNDAGVSTRLIGLILLGNAATVTLAQIPVARLAEGRRRVVMIALAAALLVVASSIVLLAQVGAAFAVLVAASVMVAVGECLYTTVLTPLVVDLAPEGLRGRYLASMGFAWWIGLTIAPTFGAMLLSVSPTATFAAAAALAAGAGISSLRLERRLPDAARRTPRPARVRA